MVHTPNTTIGQKNLGAFEKVEMARPSLAGSDIVEKSRKGLEEELRLKVERRRESLVAVQFFASTLTKAINERILALTKEYESLPEDCTHWERVVFLARTQTLSDVQDILIHIVNNLDKE